MFRRISCALLGLVALVTVWIVLPNNINAQDDTAKTRLLVFSDDRSMGELSVGPPVGTPYEEVKVFGEQFKSIGPAKGTVEVPAGRMIKLEFTQAACKDLSPLATLPADSLHVIYFRSREKFHGNQFQHLKHMTDVRWLMLRSSPVNDEGFANFAGFKKLEYLRCSVYGHSKDGFGITDKSMKVIGGFKKLRILSLRDNPITDVGLKYLSNCDDLEVLGLDGSNVDGSGLEELILLSKLQSLSFGAYDKGAPIDDKSMKIIVQLDQLKHLDLSGTAVTDDGLKDIRRLKNLETLTLDHSGVTENGLAHLEGLNKLKRLRCYLDHNHLGDDAALYLANLPSLEKVTAHFELTTEGVRSLSKLTNLKSFDFNHGLTDEALVEVGKMTGLEDISIQNCPNVTDAGIAHLKSLVNVERFSIRATIATPACIESIAKLPKLTSLSLSFEQNADAPMLWPAVEDWKRLGQLTKLESLKLDGLLLDKRHWSVFEKMTELRDLEVNNYLPLDDSFFKVVGALPELQSLRLEAVDESGANGLKYLTDSKLSFLQVAGPIGLEQLKPLAKNVNLRVLYLYTSGTLPPDDLKAFEKMATSLQRVSNQDGERESYFEVGANGIVRHGHPDARKLMNGLVGKAPPKLIGAKLPGGGEFDLKPYLGKVVIVHFWTAYSIGRKPRPDEVHVRNVVSEFKDADIQVVGVHSTARGEVMEAFIKEQGIKWPCIVDKDDLTKKAWGSPRRNGLFLIDRKGNVKMAGVYQGDLKNAIEMMLKEK